MDDKLNGKINKMKKIKKGQRLGKVLIDKITTYLIAAFGLVAGLAWNDAIKSSIEFFIPLQGNRLLMKFGYAILITFIFAILTVYILKLIKKEDK